MTRSALVVLLACPVTLALACGSENSGPSGSEGGRASEGGASVDAGAGGLPTEGGSAGTGQGGASNGGQAGQAGQGATGADAGAAGEPGGAGSPSGGSPSGGSPNGGSPSGGTAGATPTGGTSAGGASTGGVTTGGVTTGGTSTGGVSTGGTSTGGVSTGGTSTGGTSEIVLTVTTNADVHPISPLIYGVNLAHGVTCSNSTARFSLCRLGGNPWSTYNWENNASNAGADSKLCSENNAALGASDDAAATVTSLIAEAGQNAAAVVTVPMLDYVAADKTSGTPYPLCSGDITKSADYQTTRLRHNQARKGAAFADPPDATDANVSQDEYLSFLKSRSGTTNVLVTLDNQPELWNQTHVALHPDHATYDEVVSRSTEYATMIRDTWPAAEIISPGGYGYLAFLNLQYAPNRPSAEFLDYFLASMKVAGDTAGKRLIDYLDVHWYPEFPDTASDRVQAPRSLWDPSYTENSWIGAEVGPIKLVPWLLNKVSLYYPGTKVSISSYAYGGVDDISGAIAVADALGVFGRERVSLAGLQPQDGNNTFNIAAFAAFRNYDGAGAAFGDQSVRATTSNMGSVSIYASTDSEVADRVVIVAINRSPDPSPVRLDVQHATAFTSADVYRVTSAASVPAAAAALTSAGENRFQTTLPGYSVSVIVPKP